MSRRTVAAARIESPAAPRPPRIRTTVGELIAAAYDVLGPDADPDAVAAVLLRLQRGHAPRPAVAIG